MSNKVVKTYRISPDMHKDFISWCEDNDTNPSREIQIFIKEKIKTKKGKPITLTEYVQKKQLS